MIRKRPLRGEEDLTEKDGTEGGITVTQRGIYRGEEGKHSVSSLTSCSRRPEGIVPHKHTGKIFEL